MPSAEIHLPRVRTGIPGTGDPLDAFVGDAMTPGVVVVAADASIRHVFGALTRHGVHGVLVVGSSLGDAIGWITAEGLSSRMATDSSLVHAREAVSQEVLRIDPGATVREAALELARPGITHLLVAHTYSDAPVGVVTHADLVAAAT